MITKLIARRKRSIAQNTEAINKSTEAMKRFKAKIKERGSDHYLTPSYTGSDETTIEFLEEFWGVHEPDVESYEIVEIHE